MTDLTEVYERLSKVELSNLRLNKQLQDQKELINLLEAALRLSVDTCEKKASVVHQVTLKCDFIAEELKFQSTTHTDNYNKLKAKWNILISRINVLNNNIKLIKILISKINQQITDNNKELRTLKTEKNLIESRLSTLQLQLN